jgi:hypothetical protein
MASQKLLASDADEEDGFGESVAVSGRTAVVGAPEANAAYVFEGSISGPLQWQETTIIPAPPTSVSFAASVAMSGDSMAIGAMDSGGGDGRVYVYERDHGGAANWGLLKELVPPPGVAAFGRSLDIDGDTLVVGATTDPDAAGRAFVHQRDQGGANQWGLVTELVGHDTSAADEFGFTVAISADSVAVGSIDDDDADPGNTSCNSGSLYIFDRDSGGPGIWGEAAKITAVGAVCGDQLGTNLDLDRDSLVTGTFSATENTISKVYFHERDEGGVDAWGEVARHEGISFLGSSLSISGNQALVAMAHQQAWGGSVEVMHRNHGGINNWGVATTLTQPDGGPGPANGFWGDRFGSGAAIGYGFFLIGAPDDDDLGRESGSANIFGLERVRRASGRTVPDPTLKASFASTQGIANGKLTRIRSVSNSGSAYVFDLILFTDDFETGDTSAWSLVAP